MPQDPANPNGRQRSVDPAEQRRVAGAIVSAYLHARLGTAGVMGLPVGRRPIPLADAVEVLVRQGPLADSPARALAAATLFAHAFVEGRNDLAPALVALTEGRFDETRKTLETFHQQELQGITPPIYRAKTLALRVLVGGPRKVPR